MACADVLPPSGDETQGITVSTDVAVAGDFKHESSLQWRVSSEFLGVNVYLGGDEIPEPVIEPEPPLNMIREVQSECTYSEDTIAENGVVLYSKSSALETGAVFSPNDNVRNDRQFYFSGFDDGRIVSTENMMMNNYGTAIRSDALFICPFARGVTECVPSFCNRMEAGSVIDTSIISAASSSEIRNINPPSGITTDPPMPVAEFPAEASYRISIRGIDSSTPTEGLVSVYTDMVIREGRDVPPRLEAGCPYLFEEIKFEESRSFYGEIDLFTYEVDYESGVVR